MNVRLRERLINAAIWSVALSAVLLGGGTACSAQAPESGLPRTHTTTVGPVDESDPCVIASRIDDYVVRFEDGSETYVTPREDVRQSAWEVHEGSITLGDHKAHCAALVRQAVQDRQSIDWR